MDSLKMLLVLGIICLFAVGCGYPLYGSGDGPDSWSCMAREFDRSLCEFDGLCFSVVQTDTSLTNDQLLTLEEKVVAAVWDMKAFDTTFMGVCEDTSRAILNSTAVITDADIIRPGFFASVFKSERNRVILEAEVVFIDAASRDTIGTYSVMGKCSGTNPRGAISLLADEIVGAIRDNCF